MYKPKYITRTIKLQHVEIVWLDTLCNDTRVTSRDVPGNLSKETDILKYLTEDLVDPNLKAVHIASITPVEKRYKMREDIFMRYADASGENEEKEVEGEDEQ